MARQRGHVPPAGHLSDRLCQLAGVHVPQGLSTSWLLVWGEGPLLQRERASPSPARF